MPPPGIQTFEDIIDEGYVYVDKTVLIHPLTDSLIYMFLSRPLPRLKVALYFSLPQRNITSWHIEPA